MKTSVMIRKASLAILLAYSLTGFGRQNQDNPGGSTGDDGQRLSLEAKVLAGCDQGKAQTELKLNNVRTRVLTGGDMWWDLTNAKYEVPKGSGSMASFAGSLWFGGYINGNLKVSAMTYRQNGVDFWPGPVDPTTADVDFQTCKDYDKHWRIKREDVDKMYSNYVSQGLPVDLGAISSSIVDYPGNPPVPTTSYYYLAPFEDIDNDGYYNPAVGDYPRYNVTGANVAQGDCKRRLFGDETLFWVFNDVGNTHSESGSVGNIGVEIRAQAFAFASSDELNDMTFYNFEIINRSTNKLDSTIFAVWVDADLGNYQDDYIGCDVTRGLGYIYNGDNYDDDNGGVVGYHDQLPALGCDFFQGPNSTCTDGLDNDKDGCVDCTYWIDNLGVKHTDSSISCSVLPEQIIMSRFTYYNNTSNLKNGNPNSTGNGIQFYNLMNGRWKDGTSMMFGTDGIAGSVPCVYLYPGDSDPLGYSTNGVLTGAAAVWWESAAPGDRRFLQSAGQFELAPGSVNYITFGMPFARSATNSNLAAIPLLQAADDKAQALFDNCFKVLDGPDAPDLTIQELDKQLILYLSNKPGSNNYEQKRYIDLDVTINPNVFPNDTNTIGTGLADRFYRFEGYLIYQLKDETVSQTDLYDADKARLVFQTDLENGVARIINYNTDPTLGTVPQLMVEGADAGLKNSFVFTQDQFAEGDKTVVNHKTYYFMVLAYAYNNHLPYRQDIAPSYFNGAEIHPATGDFKGQKKPFLRGRKNIKVYSGIPHIIAPEANGTVASSSYGSGVEITRYEGQGNGGRALDLNGASIDRILKNSTNKSDTLTYERGRGPFNVKVVDPLNVIGGNFTMKFMKNTGIKYKVGKIVAAPGDTVSFKGADSLTSGTRNISDLTTDTIVGVLNGSKFGWEIKGSYVKNGTTYYSVWHSDANIGVNNEQILVGRDGVPLGFSIEIKQVTDPQPTVLNKLGSAKESDVLESSISYSGSAWLTGLKDGDGQSERNWIRSGTETYTASQYNDIYQKNGNSTLFGDPSEIYEKIVNGTWAPYRFTSYSDPGSAPGSNNLRSAPRLANGNANYHFSVNQTLNTCNLASVDIVFTSDKSKWTRCPVIEMAHYGSGIPTVDSNYKYMIRRDYSIDKNGNKATSFSPGQTTNPDAADYISSRGMGWFPGYAINVETGERLNMAYAENSRDTANRGHDMMWNPTSVTVDPVTGQYVVGGMHYIYVFGHNGDGVKNGYAYDMPRYDAGRAMYNILKFNPSVHAFPQIYAATTATTPRVSEVWKDAMWVNMPLLNAGYSFPSAGSYNIPGGDIKVKIRVKKPFRYGQSGAWSGSHSSIQNQFYTQLVLTSTLTPTALTTDTSTSASNNNFPMYSFSTNDLIPTLNDENTAKDALALINVVPNPYYGHSSYERTRIENVIKITNLPVKCKIRIYTLNGTLIRTLEKDNDQTYVTWDLTNKDNIKIASGLYIIHVDAPGIGERILKWFGVMRPLDLQSY